DSLIGFVVFKWFPYENDCSHIIFDSIDVGLSYDPCSGQPTIFDTASEGIIGSYPSCGLNLESDVDPPQVEIRKDPATFSDTVLFSDGRATDEGLRSIAWFPEPGTDTSKIVVLPVSPPILRCFDDKQIHRVEVRQLDTTAAGCYDFIFTDCVGHQVFDTICMAAHMLEGVNDGGREFTMTLEANHPNPFSRTTIFSYSTLKDGLVRLSLFDELGREVAQPVSSRQSSGRHTQEFDGSKLPEGNYIVRLESGGKVLSRRVVIER
ncbi:MAG: T9SS type A sorting domain-containing protein, partial [Bacteroidota bacterium]|nr:T9SS type A sorting domain-containing protein [Bacteroidota bacterium]